MNKILTIVTSLTFVFLEVSAQINPMQGYIITNEGDTIHGTIDYRSDAKNARECNFMAEGQTSRATALQITAYTISQGRSLLTDSKRRSLLNICCRVV